VGLRPLFVPHRVYTTYTKAVLYPIRYNLPHCIPFLLGKGIHARPFMAGFYSEPCGVGCPMLCRQDIRADNGLAHHIPCTICGMGFRFLLGNDCPCYFYPHDIMRFSLYPRKGFRLENRTPPRFRSVQCASMPWGWVWGWLTLQKAHPTF
jgi:hypothetical protein